MSRFNQSRSFTFDNNENHRFSLLAVVAEVPVDQQFSFQITPPYSYR